MSDLQERRIEKAVQYAALLAKLNYDSEAALQELDSDRQLFEQIRESVLQSKADKRIQQRKCQVQHNRRRAREKGALGSFTAQQWHDLQAEYCWCCAYCGLPTKKLTVDHVIPLSKGGSNDISNLKPACKSCNSRKGSRLLENR